MTKEEEITLGKTACKVRMGVLTATHGAKAGHPGGSLSAADVFAYLYFRKLNIAPQNPKRKDRDRFVLSEGHSAPGLYAALAYRGSSQWTTCPPCGTLTATYKATQTWTRCPVWICPQVLSAKAYPARRGWRWA